MCDSHMRSKIFCEKKKFRGWREKLFGIVLEIVGHAVNLYSSVFSWFISYAY